MEQFLFGVGAQKLPSRLLDMWHCPWHVKLTMVPFLPADVGIPGSACMHTVVSVGGWLFWCLLLYVCFRMQLFLQVLPKQNSGIPGSACTL